MEITAIHLRVNTNRDNRGQLYNTQQVLNATDISAANRKEFVKHGFIKPVVEATNRGLNSYYNFKNIVQIKIITLLVSNKIHRSQITTIFFATTETFTDSSKDLLSDQFEPTRSVQSLKARTFSFSYDEINQLGDLFLIK